ncbi:MAG: hypothetical protein MZW92_59795 [Comamonadaceae bacterium]|nr:hypothetical protein [Comamonadaceae bacterium]
MDAALLAQALALADAAPGRAPRLRRAARASWRRCASSSSTRRTCATRRRRPSACAAALWLGASDGHCWQITADPTHAGALFVADRALTPRTGAGGCPCPTRR